MASFRKNRVNELVKRALSEITRSAFPIEDVGVVSINEVKMASDFQSATIFVGVVGSTAQQAEAIRRLNAHRKQWQGLLAQEATLRYTPILKFVLDESIERGNRVLSILEEIEKAEPSSPASLE